MEHIRRRLGPGLVVFAVLFFAAGCELSEGGGDAGDVDAGDVGVDTPAQCVVDGFCDLACATGTDPDCTCECDRNGGICDASAAGSRARCDCDDDCSVSSPACDDDSFCDTFCAAGADLDCRDTTCACDRDDGACDVEREEGDEDDPCVCDIDCGPGDQACQDDGYVDEWCLARDPDFEDTVSDCDYFIDVCEADANHSSDPCTDGVGDQDCEGGEQACSADDHCDRFCDPPTGSTPMYDCKDPDCNEDADGNCVRP